MDKYIESSDRVKLYSTGLYPLYTTTYVGSWLLACGLRAPERRETEESHTLTRCVYSGSPMSYQGAKRNMCI